MRYFVFSFIFHFSILVFLFWQNQFVVTEKRSRIIIEIISPDSVNQEEYSSTGKITLKKQRKNSQRSISNSPKKKAYGEKEKINFLREKNIVFNKNFDFRSPETSVPLMEQKKGF